MKRKETARTETVHWDGTIKALSRASLDGFFIIDQHGNFTEANATFCAWTGYTPGEILSRTIMDIEVPGTPEGALLHIVEGGGGSEGRFLTSYRRNDGTIMDVEISAIVLPTDGENHIFAFVRDVESRKEMIWRDLTSSSLLELYAKKTSRKEYLDAVVDLLQSWSGWDSVGIRLINDSGSMPYESAVGFDREYLEAQNGVSLQSPDCDFLRGVIENRDPREGPAMTGEGSFFCNDIGAFIEGLPGNERPKYRDIGARGNSKSVAVIPLRYQDTILGVIHLADELAHPVPIRIVNFIQSVAPMVGEAVSRFNMEGELKINYDTQSVINSIFRLTFDNISLDEILARSLDLVFSMPWLAGEQGGCLFLSDGAPGGMTLKAHRGLGAEYQESCARVAFGECACGRAIEKKGIQLIQCSGGDGLADCVGERPHSHICAPIESAGRNLGLLVINLRGETRPRGNVELNISSIVNTLAGIIIQYYRDKELLAERHKLQSILTTMNDGVVIVGRDCAVEYVNPVMEADFGQPGARKCFEYILDRTELCEWCIKGEELPDASTRREWSSPKNGKTYDIFSTVFRNVDDSVSKVEFFHDITDLKRSEREIKRQAGLLARVSDAIISFDAHYLITYWNYAAERIYGWRAADAVGRSIIDLLQPLFLGADGTEVARDIGAMDSFSGEMLHRRMDGTTIPIEAKGMKLVDRDGADYGFVTVNRDITERKLDEAEKMKLLLAVEQASDWVVITDREGTIEYTNQIVEQITGYRKEEVIGNNPRMLKSGRHDESFYRNMWNTILSGSTFRSIFINRKKDGDLCFIDTTITPLKDGRGAITNFIASGKDITQQKHMEDRLIALVHYDVLTGLPNRTLFMDRLNQAMARAEFSKRLIAVLIIDIDKFKFMNDTFGAETGDGILKTIAGRLQESVREGDVLARLGSDEFGLALVDVAQKEDFIIIVEKIRAIVSQPLRIKDNEIVLTASIGISIYPYDGDKAHTIMQNADIAFTKSKIQGRNHYQFYTSDMNLKASEFMKMEKNLFTALENDEFEVYYQPYFEIATRKMVGMESLLRWESRNLGFSLPESFIPILEETGMIIPVGMWILQRVCRQIKQWLELGYPVVPIAVNVSPVQFRQRDFAQSLENMIVEYGVDPRYLIFEITENILMHDLEFASAMLKKMRDIGFNISIDDFGTGYSSLSYLKRFPLNFIKIDRSFIKDITTDPDSGSIVTAIISLSHSLNLKTIAEGVETEDQFNILRILRCDIIQGYFLSRPVTADLVKSMFVVK